MAEVATTPAEQPADEASASQVFTPDASAPPHLIPSIDRPRDAHFFTSVIIIELDGGEGDRPIDSPLDLMEVDGASGATRPAEGVILTHRQAWESQGLALGNLLHSLTLAPGEVTQVAMIDWNHRARGEQKEGATQDDHLAQAGEQSRGVSEITNGVAREHQSGMSVGAASSTAVQGGVGGGLGGFLGFSGGASHNSSIATNVSFSAGDREIAQSANQQLQQRTHQQADAVRTRRATVVKETSEGDDETLTTRIVANYNHGHALTVQYFEVLETYAIKTRVVDAERCLFVPMRPFDFGDPRVLHRYRDVLKSVAHTDRVAELLDKVRPADDTVLLKFTESAFAVLDDLQTALRESDSGMDETAIHDFLYALRLSARARSPHLTIPGAVPLSATELRLPAGAALISMQQVAPFGEGVDRLRQAGMLAVRRRHVSDAHPPEMLELPPEGVRLADIREIVFTPNELTPFQDPRQHLAQIELQFRSASGHTTSHSTLLPIRSTTGPITIASVVPPDLADAEELGALMAPLRLAYSQAIWASMDQVTIRELMADRSHEGEPLGDSVVPMPIAITGNLVGFTWPFPASRHRSRDSFRQRHMSQVGVSDLVSVPTGGVFAEAVLGQSKSAERIETDRFWKWQDSPIPLTPPKIDPLDSKPRGSGVPLSSPTLDQAAAVLPTAAPFPTFNGTAEAIKALTTANMFRDMSGMAQVASMLETAIGASSTGATAAGAQASKNFETYTKYLQAMVEQLAPLVEGALTDGAGPALTETMKGGLAAKKATSATAGAAKAPATAVKKTAATKSPAKKATATKTTKATVKGSGGQN